VTAFDYAPALATANDLIARYGKPGNIRRAGAPTGSAHNQTPGTPVDHPVTFVTLKYATKDIDGVRVLATDKRVLCAVGALAIMPTTSDLLAEATGAPYKIMAVDALEPGDTTLLYWIQARR
jgi:hypothetical protein